MSDIPAFPSSRWLTKDDKMVACTNMEGMSLRDYFAAQAMQAAMMQTFISHNNDDWPSLMEAETAARISYRFADAMMVEREKK